MSQRRSKCSRFSFFYVCLSVVFRAKNTPGVDAHCNADSVVTCIILMVLESFSYATNFIIFG